MTTPVSAYATHAATENLEPFSLDRRDVGTHDVMIDIDYCGVCHTDIHQARNDWGVSIYPMVPGHEIIGRVVEVGDAVQDFKIGDPVGVGCLVDSCRECDSCHEGLEQYCENGFVGTYNGQDKRHGGGVTYGGYSEKIVVDEKFVLKMPESIYRAAAAPLLCAGITTWSPLMHWKVKKGDKVGIIPIEKRITVNLTTHET